VMPALVPAAGGTIVIRGMGFRQGDTVQVGGVRAQVLSILPNEITALAPAAGVGVTDVVPPVPQAVRARSARRLKMGRARVGLFVRRGA